MRSLPAPDPGVPDARGPVRYLLWLTRMAATPLAVGIMWAILWRLCQALIPAVIGLIVDALTGRDAPGLITWSAVLLGVGVAQALTSILHHRAAVYLWLGSAYRTIQVTVRQAARLGATLPKRLATGEVISVGNSDIEHIGSAMAVLPTGTASAVAVGAVTVILITTSPVLGLMVLLGVPLMAAAITPLLRPLHRRQHRYRDLQSELATRAMDIVTGLRILRGIGGERLFADRYREESQRVRRAGVRVAAVESTLVGGQILLPGLLIAAVTWVGATFAAQGRISAGELVTFYGYAVFLIAPLRALTDMADKLTKSHVAARRVVRILTIEPELTGGDGVTEGGTLADAASGARVEQGTFTAIAAATPEDAVRIADRLGRYTDGEVTFGGVPLGELPLAEVRRRILVAGNDARLFTGRLREELDPTGMASDEELRLALYAACAEDIVEALPDGLDTFVAEAGLEFSGGQRQRLRLVRALLADPEVLILVEPTSAVDAHSEARIADRIAKHRAGRTTVVCTTSPLVLDRADRVLYVEDGVVRAEGMHRDLLAAEPRYRATVTREEDS